MIRNDFSLVGKTALVTGGNTGIGRAVCLAFADAGADVVVAWHSDERAAGTLVESIKERGRRAVAVEVNVTQQPSVEHLFEQALRHFDAVDILVNNAGMGGYRPFLQWSEEDYDKIMATNAKSTWLFCREAIPHMLSQGGGQIVNVASVAGLQGYPSEAIYCSSKFAQLGMTQALDREFWQQGIKVAAVCPGGVETFFALGDGRTAGSDHLKGFSTADDVAEAIVMAALPRERSRIVNIIMRPMNEAT